MKPALLTDQDIKARMRQRLAADASGAGKPKMALELGITEGTLSRILRDHLPVNAAIAGRMGLRAVVMFEPVE